MQRKMNDTQEMLSEIIVGLIIVISLIAIIIGVIEIFKK
jgi:hypothetical protein